MPALRPAAARQAALEATGLLDAAPSATLERLTRLVRRMLGVPLAMVNLADGARLFYAAASGMDGAHAERRESPLDESLCEGVVSTGAALHIRDARRDQGLCAKPGVLDGTMVAYLGVPLVTQDGHVLGSFCAVDSEARDWNDEDLATMQDLAQVVMAELTARAAANSHQVVSEHYSDLLDTTTELVCSLDERGRVTYVNRAWCATLGYEAHEAIGMSAQRIVPAAEGQRYRDIAAALRATGVVENVELTMVTRTGRKVIGHGRATAVRSHDGRNRILSSHAVYRDVTIERRAEQENRVLLQVTQALAETRDISTAMTTALRILGSESGWEYAEAWLPADIAGWTPAATQTMRLQLGPVWHVPSDARLVWFREQTSRLTFGPGEGLPGHVVSTKGPMYVPELATAHLVSRLDAARATGFHAAHAVPVLIDGAVYGVLSFFSRDAAPREPSQLRLVEAVAAQVGTVLQRALAETALRESERRLSLIYNNVTDLLMFARVERHGAGEFARFRILSVNDRLATASLRRPEEYVGHTLDEVSAPANLDMLRGHWRSVAKSGEPLQFESTSTDRNGRAVYAETTLTPVLGANGRCTHILSASRDVTASREADAARRESEGAFRKMLETIRALAMIVDADGRVLFANDSLLALTGWSRDEVIGSDWFERFVPDNGPMRRLFNGVMSGEDTIPHNEHQLLTRTGRKRLVVWDNTALRDAQGTVVGMASIGHDVTEQRLMEKRLADLSERDELTGLLNRRGFMQQLEFAMKSGLRSARPDALLYLDLDKFKPINDSFGHGEGDSALRAVATLLRATMRESDVAGRLGGDEFAIYAVDAKETDGGASLVERLQAALVAHNQYATERGRPYTIGFSIGKATVGPGDTRETLLARADAALYEIKRMRTRPG